MSNIDGSFEVSSSAGDITLQVNKLFPKSTNSANALMGSVIALLDPEVSNLVIDIFNESSHQLLIAFLATCVVG